jgi:hypothetical protein
MKLKKEKQESVAVKKIGLIISDMMHEDFRIGKKYHEKGDKENANLYGAQYLRLQQLSERLEYYIKDFEIYSAEDLKKIGGVKL